MSNITPGVGNSATVMNWGGVKFTSDLGAKWDSAIKSLPNFDYSGIGGNPIQQYHSGLKQIHFEPFGSTGHGANMTTFGTLGSWAISTSEVSDNVINTPGVDTIYIDRIFPK